MALVSIIADGSRHQLTGTGLLPCPGTCATVGNGLELLVGDLTCSDAVSKSPFSSSGSSRPRLPLPNPPQAVFELGDPLVGLVFRCMEAFLRFHDCRLELILTVRDLGFKACEFGR